MASSKDKSVKTYTRKKKNIKDIISSSKIDVGKAQSSTSEKKLKVNQDDVSEYQRYLDCHDKWVHPVWLVIVASEEGEDYTLPQVKKSYVRIRNPDAPISIISKRIAQKLNISNDEVDVRCCGKTLPSDAPIGSLIKFWPQNALNWEELFKQKTLSELRSINPINYMIVMNYAIKSVAVGSSSKVEAVNSDENAKN